MSVLSQLRALLHVSHLIKLNLIKPAPDHILSPPQGQKTQYSLHIRGVYFRLSGKEVVPVRRPLHEKLGDGPLGRLLVIELGNTGLQGRVKTRAEVLEGLDVGVGEGDVGDAALAVEVDEDWDEAVVGGHDGGCLGGKMGES